MYLQNIWVLKIVWWEYLQLQFVWHLISALAVLVLRIFIIVLIVDQICNDVRFTDVNEEAVSDNDGSLKLGESTISFSKVSNLVHLIEWIKLNVELSTLVVVATTTHHWVNRWLILACVTRVVWIIHWNDEVIHIFLWDLFSSCVFNKASGGTKAVFIIVFFFLVIFKTIFNSEICESIVLLSSWPVLVSKSQSIVIILWHDTHWVDQ